MDRRIIALYDDYVHGTMARREFLSRLAQLAGGAAAAAALLPLLEGSGAEAAVIDPGDDRLATARVAYPGVSGEVKAYVARPNGVEAPLPGVVVIHENRGLTPHIEDVTRRLGFAGFHAMAVDALSPMGGTPADRDAARDMIRALDPETTLGDYVAAVAHLKASAQVSGRAGAVGFCWGGGMVGALAVATPALDAGVSFYGRQPAADAVAAIRAPLLLHYAGLDDRINAGIEALRAALDAAGKTYEMHVYEGVEHAFNNDARPARHDRAAAELAWARTVDFLATHLAG